jgi:hypothetical protein
MKAAELSLVLALLALPLAAEDFTNGPPACVLPASGLPSGDIERVKIADNLWVEKLRGDVALAHLYNLRARRPDALTAAASKLAARGFSPTETVYVERLIGLAQSPEQGPGSSLRLAQNYSEQNSSGEIVFWSWDDGQPNTWEGSIYIEIYSNGAASSWEGQIYSGTSDHPWVYYYKTWEQQPHPPLPTLWDAPPLPGGIVTAAMKSPFHGPPGEIMLVPSFSGWARCWRKCVVAWCSAAALGCLGATVTWPACWGATCTGAELGCGLQCYGS